MFFLAQEWQLSKNPHATDKLVNATDQLQGIASNVSDNVLEVATNVKEVTDKVSDVVNSTNFFAVTAIANEIYDNCLWKVILNLIIKY